MHHIVMWFAKFAVNAMIGKVAKRVITSIRIK